MLLHCAKVVTNLLVGREDDFKEEFQRMVELSTEDKRAVHRQTKAQRVRPNYKPKNPYLRY